MRSESPRPTSKVAVEAEAGGRSQRAEDSYGPQERRMLRGKAIGVLRKEEDDDPGTQEPEGKRCRGAHHDSNQYG
jgi:hypothetical protein